jgi:putative tryptophan/tyrosine transport system substrate-binding protein
MIWLQRREFITLLGGGALPVWPTAVRAQQAVLPVIGFLSTRAPGEDTYLLGAFHEGLKEIGFIDWRNAVIEYYLAGNECDRLPPLAADLVRRGVSVIAAVGSSSAQAAKAATTTIPIVFSVGNDPVVAGLVASPDRPGGNLTGVTLLNVELEPERLELLHELIPTTTIIAALVNPNSPAAETQSKEMQASARKLGMEIHVLNASSERDFAPIFARLVTLRASALVIGNDEFFTARSEQLAALALRYMVPTIYQFRRFAKAGGLMSYGGSLTDAYRRVGVYSGRILKGEKPADLPVQQSTKVELFINLKTANALGIEVPPSLLARADEVIE